MVKQPVEVNMSGSYGGEKLNLTGSDWTSIGTTLTGAAGDYFASQNAAKAAQAAADAQKAQAETNLQIATINAQAAAAAAAAAGAAKPGLSTGAIVGIIGGSLLLIGIVAVVALKKK